jgi:hypothetical protein
LTTSVVDNYSKLTAWIVDTGSNLPPANLPPMSLKSIVVGNSCTPSIACIFAKVKKFEMLLLGLSGAWRKMIHAKNVK